MALDPARAFERIRDSSAVNARDHVQGSSASGASMPPKGQNFFRIEGCKNLNLGYTVFSCPGAGAADQLERRV